MASVGQTSAQRRQPSGQRLESTTGRPRKRSGNAGGWFGKPIVRCFCWARASRTFSMVFYSSNATGVTATPVKGNGSQIMAAIRQIEALVAQREIGNLLVAQRHGQTWPVVKRRVHDFVTREFSCRIGQCHVADFAAPTFHE